jgi:hypothetical protein
MNGCSIQATAVKTFGNGKTKACQPPGQSGQMALPAENLPLYYPKGFKAGLGIQKPPVVNWKPGQIHHLTSLRENPSFIYHSHGLDGFLPHMT